MSIISQAVCVQKCPKQGEQPKCQTNKHFKVCPRANWNTNTQIIPNYCLPTIKDLKTVIKQLFAEMSTSGQFAKYLASVSTGWQPIAIMCAGSFFVAILYVWLLKWITKPLLYVSMVVIQIAFILGGIWLFMQRTQYKNDTNNYKWCFYGAIGVWVVALLYLVCVCCCWDNISLGASIMEAGADFISKNIRIIFLPVIAYLWAIAFFVLWIASATFVYSVGTAEYKKDSIVANIKWAKQTEYIMWYYLFGLFWGVAFFICLNQFVTATLCCMWYFWGQGGENSDNSGEVSVLKAIGWGSWYHCGSIAIGSLLIAIITIIRVIFEYLAKTYEGMEKTDGGLYKIASCCIRCVLYCLDSYVKFITKNAFIQIALSSENFCPCAWTSFYLLVRHAGRFGSADMIGFIMNVVGKGVIMSLSGFLTFLIAKYGYPLVQNPFVPAILVAIEAYFVASLFLSLFGFACTAILHCFILDEDISQRDGKSAEFTPDSLKPFLDKVDADNEEKTKNAEKADQNKSGSFKSKVNQME